MHWFLLLCLTLFASEELETHPTLRLHWRSNLVFGVAVQGDSAKTIPPDAAALSGAASVEITGRPHASYNIILPQNRISLSNTGCNCSARIWVSDFRASPPEGLNGKLDANGKQTLFIGATREAISVQQPRGKYMGNFLITAVYP